MQRAYSEHRRGTAGRPERPQPVGMAPGVYDHLRTQAESAKADYDSSQQRIRQLQDVIAQLNAQITVLKGRLNAKSQATDAPEPYTYDDKAADRGDLIRRLSLAGRATPVAPPAST